jgi:hypothetical protein
VSLFITSLFRMCTCLSVLNVPVSSCFALMSRHRSVPSTCPRKNKFLSSHNKPDLYSFHGDKTSPRRHQSFEYSPTNIFLHDTCVLRVKPCMLGRRLIQWTPRMRTTGRAIDLSKGTIVQQRVIPHEHFMLCLRESRHPLSRYQIQHVVNLFRDIGN